MRDSLGVPRQLYILPSQKVKIALSQDLFIKEYHYYPSNIDSIKFSSEEIVHHYYPDLVQGFYGKGKLAPLADSYNINDNINRYASYMFSNMGVLGGIFKTSQTLGTPSYERLKREIKEEYQGVKRVGKFALLDSGLEYQSVNISPQDLAYIVGRRETRNEIAAAFGQSPALYDAQTTRANADAAYYMLVRDTIDPEIRFIEREINEKLLPMYSSRNRLFLVFDNPIPKDREYELKKGIEEVRNSIITPNEYRERDGRDPIAGGDDRLIATNLAPYSYILNKRGRDDLEKGISEVLRLLREIKGS